MEGEIEGRGHVHGTGEHLRPIAQEVVHGLQYGPGGHGGRVPRLVGELKVIQAECLSIQDYKNSRIVESVLHVHGLEILLKLPQTFRKVSRDNA